MCYLPLNETQLQCGSREMKVVLTQFLFMCTHMYFIQYRHQLTHCSVLATIALTWNNFMATNMYNYPAWCQFLRSQLIKICDCIKKCINHPYATNYNVLQNSTKKVWNCYFSNWDTMSMCSDDPPSHTGAISSSCAQAFSGNETAFLSWDSCRCHRNGTDNRQESWATVGFIVIIQLLQHGRG